MMIKFGWPVLTSWPITAMLSTLGLSALLAMVLSFLGVIYPALVAARMQPAVAMRTEQV
jgi:ABC-type antimicrobial peptide transport system permease subunit